MRAAFLLLLVVRFLPAEATLFQTPTVNQTHIVFAYAGDLWTAPRGGGAIFGPKAMLINEYAGSGGDAMPYYFKEINIGPLIAKRTWGGLVRADRMPVLIDGGMITAPPIAIWSESGEWVAENKGVAPEIEVDQDPAAVRAGQDPQLERAVTYLLEQMKAKPEKTYQHPPYTTFKR